MKAHYKANEYSMKQINKEQANKIIDRAMWINKDDRDGIVTLIIKEKK